MKERSTPYSGTTAYFLKGWANIESSGFHSQCAQMVYDVRQTGHFSPRFLLRAEPPMLASRLSNGAPVKRLAVRSTLVACSLFGLISGCGQDETVHRVVSVDDGGASEESDVTRPGPTTPTTSGTATTTSPSPGPNDSALGAPCARDADCEGGLSCLTSAGSAWLGGGAAHGYCTAGCETDGECAAIEADSVCVGVGSQSVCVATCFAGSSSEPKCHGRADVACDPMVFFDFGISICRPMCRNDEDCDGRLCDLGSGACVSQLPDGDPIGSSCDPSLGINESTCATGQCLPGATPGTQDLGICTGLCTVGAGGCGTTEGMLDAGDPFCLPVWGGTTVGDLGLCMQSCNCDEDCNAEGFRCGRYPGALDGIGVEGFCFEFDSELATEGVIEFGLACPETNPDGGAGDAGGDGGGVAPDASTTGAVTSNTESANSTSAEPGSSDSTDVASTETDPAADAAVLTSSN